MKLKTHSVKYVHNIFIQYYYNLFNIPNHIIVIIILLYFISLSLPILENLTYT